MKTTYITLVVILSVAAVTYAAWAFSGGMMGPGLTLGHMGSGMTSGQMGSRSMGRGAMMNESGMGMTCPMMSGGSLGNIIAMKDELGLSDHQAAKLETAASNVSGDFAKNHSAMASLHEKWSDILVDRNAGISDARAVAEQMASLGAKMHLDQMQVWLEARDALSADQWAAAVSRARPMDCPMMSGDGPSMKGTMSGTGHMDSHMDSHMDNTEGPLCKSARTTVTGQCQ